MVGGVISDIYETEDRNAPMAIFCGAAIFGTGVGPLFAGFVVLRASWRWVYYSQAIAAAAGLISLTIVLKETRGSVLLGRKAKVLNTWYESLEQAGYGGSDSPFCRYSQGKRVRWKVKSDEERETLAKMISISLYRPLRKSPSHCPGSRCFYTHDLQISLLPNPLFSGSRCGLRSPG
jgi:MFS family permease